MVYLKQKWLQQSTYKSNMHVKCHKHVKVACKGKALTAGFFLQSAGKVVFHCMAQLYSGSIAKLQAGLLQATRNGHHVNNVCAV